MKKYLVSIIAAITCSLHTCATSDILAGKEVTVSMGADGKPQVGVTFGK